MKLSEAIKRLDKSEKYEDEVYLSELAEREFDIQIDWEEQDRLKSYWLGNWYCTDQYVGYKLYFLDDEPVAISIQQGRKCDEDFKWLSLEKVTKVRNYLLSFKEKEENPFEYTEFCDLEDEIGENYRISYNNQLLNSDRLTYQGEKVRLIEELKESPYGVDNMVIIELSNKEQLKLNIKELDIEFNLLEEEA